MCSGRSDMAAKALKLTAIPAALGLASWRVHALNEDKTHHLIAAKELSIYGSESQQYQFVEEEPGLLQKGVGAVRVGLTPYVRAVKGACMSIKIGAVNLYYAGEDIYHYLKDPPPGFLPRISLITVSGLAGLVLAREGSRMKRLAASLGLATVGAAICYPAPTIGVFKLTGKKAYIMTQWSIGTVASLWRPSPLRDIPGLSTSPRSRSESEVPPAKIPHDSEAIPPTEKSNSAPPSGEEPSLDPYTELDSSSVTEFVPVLDSASPVLLEAEEEHIAEQTSEVNLKSVVGEQRASEEPPSPEAILSKRSTDVDTSAEKSQLMIDPRLMDHGQSNPEDADLYSTRS
ncbi:MICOS complex subunit MIC27 [Scleropages formosus]|uniref:MICOS complex subunit n=1 Tax=Scleropages formosus TaxID=113540 RepID=A0A8C9RM76_SCLFO|nr:MICOS complex subunit MIC27 [Scleropages formosus]